MAERRNVVSAERFQEALESPEVQARLARARQVNKAKEDSVTKPDVPLHNSRVIEAEHGSPAVHDLEQEDGT